MAAGDDKPELASHRKWEQIARELSEEQDGRRIAPLVEELNQALQEQLGRKPPRAT